ncbi:hypothetical protein HU200_028862 [Digitaria exilis]|uniref:Uncharacterized protein n=1 Tax=Digitaria exilis TaxID=1010633 RepID=A0A835BZH1_9POAL|nr:hypothetical protein HU200_028862 [Digitaria exilis]
MSLAVRKSSPVVVRPSPEPAATTRATVKLSSFNMGLYNMPTTSLLVFEHPLHNAAETIQAALSRALAHYHPVAGRIVAREGGSDDEDDDEVYIDCNGEGVAFVAASASQALKEIVCFNDLAVYYPDMACGPGDPLLLMQVTEFSCGGFVLGVTWNQGVADGAGMGQFLNAVGELAAGQPSPSVPPVRWDGSLPSLPLSVLEAQQHMLSLEPLSDLVSMHITISMESINSIRADFSSSFHGQPCTTFEAALAVLWQCRTRAIRVNPETPTLLMFVADVRRHVGAMEGYYGNCIVEQFVMARSGEVADGDVKDVVMAIKRAKDRVPGLLKEDEGEGMVSQQELRKVDTYGMLLVTSWRNLGFDLVDFGSGRPAKVTYSGKDMPPSPAALGFLSNGRDGVSVL